MEGQMAKTAWGALWGGAEPAWPGPRAAMFLCWQGCQVSEPIIKHHLPGARQ